MGLAGTVTRVEKDRYFYLATGRSLAVPLTLTRSVCVNQNSSASILIFWSNLWRRHIQVPRF